MVLKWYLTRSLAHLQNQSLGTEPGPLPRVTPGQRQPARALSHSTEDETSRSGRVPTFRAAAPLGGAGGGRTGAERGGTMSYLGAESGRTRGRG